MKAKQWATAVMAALLMWTGAFGCAQAEPTEGSRGILYKVSGTKGTLYLLGSIHVGSEGMYPFSEAISRAMADSDTFVYECDTTSEAAVGAVRNRMALPTGENLTQAIGAQLYAQVSDVCQSLGLDIAVLNGLKPWAVVNTLAVYATSAEMGTDNVEQALSLGVEKQVQAYAASNRKATAYLETLNEQLDILEGFSAELTAYLLQSECDAILHPENVKGMDSTISQWPEWWRQGDTSSFADTYLNAYLEPGHETVCAEYHTRLVTERNARMAERLASLLEDGGRYFVTIGLLHLVLPEDSVVTLLREKGYTVEALSQP